MNTSLFFRLRAFFLFTLLLLASARAEPTGVALVEARLPHFYKALVARVGAGVTAEYLKGWTTADVECFEGKITKLSAATAASEARVPSTDQLFVKHSSSVFGMMGEVFGNVRSRERTEAAAVFMDEVAYAKLNPEGKKPDGLAYEIRDNRLLIHFVMESKAGQNGYDSGQMEGVLNRWREFGIKLKIDGVERVFLGRDVDLLVKTATGFDSKPLASTSNSVLQAAVFLVATRQHPSFRGAVDLLPINASTLREVIYEYIENLRAGRPVISLRENFRVPELPDPTDVEEYRNELRDWVGEHGTFPKAGGETALEKYMARQVSKRGGQTKAFVNDLDDVSRHLMATLAFRGRLVGDNEAHSLPAMSQMERIFTLSRPEDPGILSSLRAYFRGYVRSREVRTIEAHPLIRTLRRNAEWDAYFAKHSPDELMHSKLEDIGQCLIWLAGLQKRILPTAVRKPD